MNKIHFLLFSFLILVICQDIKAQFTLTHDGVNREYYVSYPEGVVDPCPLIINLHNFNGSATFIQQYSEMDDYALPANIAVVYPEGIDNSWNVGAPWDNNTNDDVGFIDVLIDSVAANFNINLDRVYACGYSNGGYMAYELACELSHKIAAFGSVCGNFMYNSDQICDLDRLIPIIDFHGTGDPFVAYDVAFDGEFSDDGSLLINENIGFWMYVNSLTDTTIEQLPDIDTSDSTTVEKYSLYSEDHDAELIHYKINDGGHQWFGSAMGDEHISYIGLNNHDIHVSEELIDFFMNYRLSDFISVGIIDGLSFSIPTDYFLYQNYPNPFNPNTVIKFEIPVRSKINLTIYDTLGKKIRTLLNQTQDTGTKIILWDGKNENGDPVSAGVYLYQIEAGKFVQNRKMVLLK